MEKKFPKFSELMVYSTHLRPNELFSIRGSIKRACIEFRIKLVSPKAAQLAINVLNREHQ